MWYSFASWDPELLQQRQENREKMPQQLHQFTEEVPLCEVLPDLFLCNFILSSLLKTSFLYGLCEKIFIFRS